ncbi:MAG: Hpt domain-containing protein, partial [Tepidisphaeraceae bacterium]
MSPHLMSQDPAFSHRFVTEAREHLAAMTSAMIALERNEGAPQAVIEQLLRAAHSIKGGAGFTGRRTIERLAHAMEEAIENIRDGLVARSPEVIDTLLAVLDRITAMIDDLDHSDDADITEPLARLKPLIDAGSRPETLPAAPVAAPDFPLSSRVLEAWRPGDSYLFGVKFDWFQCEQQCGLSPLRVVERLERVCTVMESQTHVSGPPLSEGLPQPPMWFLAVVSSSLAPKVFTERLDIACATVIQLREKSPEPVAKAAPTAQSRSRASSGPTSLRISVPLVDKMMALAGELVLVRNQAMRAADPSNSPLRRLLRRLDSVTNELQDAALRMRTQPVGTLFDRFPRMVRDLARQLGKQIDVEITGSEVELDKTILE